MSPSRFATVDDDLATLGQVEAATAREIVRTILMEFPKTDVNVAWNVPQIHRGKWLAELDAG